MNIWVTGFLVPQAVKEKQDQSLSWTKHTIAKWFLLFQGII